MWLSTSGICKTKELRTGLSVQRMPPALPEEDETPLLLQPYWVDVLICVENGIDAVVTAVVTVDVVGSRCRCRCRCGSQRPNTRK